MLSTEVLEAAYTIRDWCTRTKDCEMCPLYFRQPGKSVTLCTVAADDVNGGALAPCEWRLPGLKEANI